MHFEFPHQLSKERAVAKIRTAITKAKTQLPKEVEKLTDEWQDSTLHFSVTLQGKNITGTVQVTDTDYVVDAKLPLMWRMFEGKFEQMIQEAVRQQLSEL